MTHRLIKLARHHLDASLAAVERLGLGVDDSPRPQAIRYAYELVKSGTSPWALWADDPDDPDGGGGYILGDRDSDLTADAAKALAERLLAEEGITVDRWETTKDGWRPVISTVRRPAWPALSFDEAAVREWLADDATRVEVIGYDADLPDYPASHDDDTYQFLSQVDALVTHAADNGLFGDDGRVRVYFTPMGDFETSGVTGGIVSVDYRTHQGGPVVRFASFAQDPADLTAEPDATGVDGAVSILAAVTATAAEVLANAGRVLGLVAPPTEDLDGTVEIG